MSKTLDISSYDRKTFTVQAVQVTEENLRDVATWCEGSLHVNSENPEETYIKVDVLRPMNEKQTKAFIGDWVLRAGTGFKVYTDKAFRKSFDKSKNQNVPVPRPPKRRQTAMEAAWAALDPEERAKYEKALEPEPKSDFDEAKEEVEAAEETPATAFDKAKDEAEEAEEKAS